MTISGSFLRIETSLRKGFTGIPSFLVFHHPGQAKELRAHLEARPLRRLGVDLEAHPLAVDVEIDAAAPGRESGVFADREGRGSLQRLQHLRRLLAVGAGNEQEVTAAQ